LALVLTESKEKKNQISLAVSLLAQIGRNSWVDKRAEVHSLNSIAVLVEGWQALFSFTPTELN
jgi:hypothetical protein